METLPRCEYDSDPRHPSSHYTDDGKINRDLSQECIIKVSACLITFSRVTSYSWRERRAGGRVEHHKDDGTH